MGRSPRVGSWEACNAAGLDLRRAAPAGGGADRPVRALRLLPPHLPDLLHLARGNGFPARPDLLDEARHRRQRANDGYLRRPFRQLPRLHGVPHRVPIGRAIRQAGRSDARADRASLLPLVRRSAVPPDDLRAVSPSGAPARPDLAALAVPALRPARAGASPRGAAMESLLPELTLGGRGTRLPPRVPAQGERRRRVGLLLGCVQRVFFAEVNAATARVLAAEGCEVIVPPEQGCCGALMVHAGMEQQALDAARRLIDAFAGAEVDTVVTNAAGCGSTMKEYAHLLRDDPEYAERARALGAKCRDVSELLAELEPRSPRHSLGAPLRVAYHDACHLQHAQNVRLQPRRLLGAIPQVELVEIADAALCCGSAGIFNLIEPRAAADLGDRKVRACLATDPDVIVSGNPGCLLQLSAGLARLGRTIPVIHTIQLLDYSLRGMTHNVVGAQHAAPLR